MLCDNLGGGMGWRVGKRFKREGMYVYVQLIHDLPTQHCKAIILQFKKKKKKAYLKKKNLPQYWGCGFDPWSGNAACEPQLLSAHITTRESAPQQCCTMQLRPDTAK